MHLSKKIDKTCFQHDLNLNIRTVADTVLRDKAFNITKNPKYDGHQRGLASMVCKFFDKKTSVRIVKNGNISNKE